MLQPSYDLRGVRFSQHGNVCCEEKWEEAGPGTWGGIEKDKSCNDPQTMQSCLAKMPFFSEKKWCQTVKRYTYIYIYTYLRLSNWLVVWNMNFIFPYFGNNHPNWRTHIFQMGRSTTNQTQPQEVKFDNITKRIQNLCEADFFC